MYRLVADEVRGEGQWVWRLFDPDGGLIAHHEVDLDTTRWEWQALQDLRRRVHLMADEEDRLASEARFVAEVGRWTATHVLGAVAAKLAQLAPQGVLLEVPPDAVRLLRLPLSVAVVEGRSLAERRVALAGVVAGWPTTAKAEVAGTLRVLAVFSVPSGQALLDLRRERKELTDLARTLLGTRGLAVEVVVVQYGATAERLKELLLDGVGWDVVHVAGHGTTGQLVLEDDAGEPQLVATEDIVAWLRDARSRLKLVSLSACSSAEVVAAQTLRSIGVDADGPVEPGEANDEEVLGQGLAIEIARVAECAVVAMRYPVVDDFAIASSIELFRALWERRQPIADAAALASARAAGDAPSYGAPAISLFTPATFGASALGTTLTPPSLGTDVVPDVRMAGFEAEPERFVGRVRVMTSANRALAPRSGRTGVLFHGMAGAGKTACALELAYGQRANFQRCIWFRCPDAPASTAEIGDAIERLGRQLDAAIGVPIVDKVHEADSLSSVLDRITEAMENSGTLVVLDNLESLLSSTGAWLDPRWALMVEALTSHRGLGRVVMTSRIAPSAQPPGVLALPVHALGREEAVLLMRQLPSLRGLIEGKPLPTRDGRRRALAVLQLAGGHPKLMELADAAAADGPAVLDRLLDAARTVWGERGVETGEFLDGKALEGDASIDGYIDLLRRWARRALVDLADADLLLLQVICRCDQEDRNDSVVESTWRSMCAQGGVDPGDLAHHLGELERRALVETIGSKTRDLADLTTSMSVHPVIVDVVLSDIGDDLRDDLDEALVATMATLLDEVLRLESEAAVGTDAVGYVAVRAAEYFERAGHLDVAVSAWNLWFSRDQSAYSSMRSVAPLRRLSHALAGTEHEMKAKSALAMALFQHRPSEAEALLIELEGMASAASDDVVAANAAGTLAQLYTSHGQRGKADEAGRRAASYRPAPDGWSWTALALAINEVWLHVRSGDAPAALRLAEELVEVLDELERRGGSPGPTFDVAESLYQVAQIAASRCSEWGLADTYGRLALDSHVQRGASDLDLAICKFNLHPALLEVGRFDDARHLLEECRAVFEASDHLHLGACVSAMAQVELRDGHPAQGVVLEHRALRFKYRSGDPELISVSHRNLALCHIHLREPGQAILHLLAAAVIHRAARSAATSKSVALIAQLITDEGEPLPDYDDLCRELSEIDGVALDRVIEVIGADGLETFRCVIEDVSSMLGQLRSHWLARDCAVLLALARRAAAGSERALDVIRRVGDETSPVYLGPEVAVLARWLRAAVSSPSDPPVAERIEPGVLRSSADHFALGDPASDPEPFPEEARSLIETVVRLRAPGGDPADREAFLAAVDEAEGPGRPVASSLRALVVGGDVSWPDLDPIQTLMVLEVLEHDVPEDEEPLVSG